MLTAFGPHIVSQGNVTGPQVDDLFRDGRRALAIYGDPPWGEGNVKYWATKASKDTGQEVAAVSYDTLIARWIDLAARYSEEHVFIETGLRWKQDTLDRMQAIGLRSIQVTTLLYRSGSKMLENIILHGSKSGADVPLNRLHHKSGGGVAREALSWIARPGAIIFDPCCGMGYTAQAAIDNGMEFRGNELNPVRLDKTKNRLIRATR